MQAATRAIEIDIFDTYKLAAEIEGITAVPFFPRCSTPASCATLPKYAFQPFANSLLQGFDSHRCVRTMSALLMQGAVSQKDRMILKEQPQVPSSIQRSSSETRAHPNRSAHRKNGSAGQCRNTSGAGSSFRRVAAWRALMQTITERSGSAFANPGKESAVHGSLAPSDSKTNPLGQRSERLHSRAVCDATPMGRITGLFFAGRPRD